MIPTKAKRLLLASFIIVFAFLFSTNDLHSQCEVMVGIELDTQNIEIIPFNMDSCSFVVPYTLTNSGTCDAAMFGIDIMLNVDPMPIQIFVDTIMGVPAMMASNATSTFTTDILMQGGVCLDTMDIKYRVTISSSKPPEPLTEPVACPSGAGTMEVCANDNSIICNMDNCAVPINLTQFEGEVSNGSALLKWQTRTEINNEFFIIEHSKDAVSFEEVGKVEGAGTSFEENNYYFAHLNMVRGNNYYRLTQRDFDGHETQSKIILLENKAGKISIQPNPASDLIKVEFDNDISTDNTLEIRDINGKLFQSHHISVDENPFELNIAQLESGIYLIKFQNGSNTYVQRIIKL